MDPVLMIVANVAAVAVLFGGIALLVWLDQRGKTRRRELEHVERMRAIELGRPLEDAAVARTKALGAIGVAVPVVSISGAVVGSCVALAMSEPLWRFGAFFVTWVSCGTVCASILPLLVRRLNAPPPTDGPE